MYRNEAEYCREQAGRLLRLAQECVDPKVRNQVSNIANEWLERAKAKERRRHVGSPDHVSR